MTLDKNTIVIIDDTSSIRSFLRVTLEDEGAECYEAACGTEGLKLCSEKKPDVVILDLGLPDIDGMEVLPKIKKLPLEKQPYIIILTVRKGHELAQDIQEKGGDAYINKPFMIDDLIEVIEELQS